METYDKRTQCDGELDDLANKKKAKEVAEMKVIISDSLYLKMFLKQEKKPPRKERKKQPVFCPNL